MVSKRAERGWAKQGILLPDGSGPLTYPIYAAVRAYQNGRCACCERVLFVGDNRGECADHWHKNSDGSGPFRGVLCGGKRGCNFRFVGKVERYKIRKGKPGTGEEAALRYLAHPPAQAWLNSGTAMMQKIQENWIEKRGE
jgi:hypothetical protein